MDEFIRNSGMYRKMLDTHTDANIIATIKQKIAETIPLDEFEQIYKFNNITNIENILNIYELIDFNNMKDMCEYLLNNHALDLTILQHHYCIQDYLSHNYVSQNIAINLCNSKYIITHVIINDENDDLYSYSELLRNITHLKTLIYTKWIIPIIAKHNKLIHLEVFDNNVELGYIKNLKSLTSIKYIHNKSILDINENYANKLHIPNLNQLEIELDHSMIGYTNYFNVNTLILNTNTVDDEKMVVLKFIGINKLILNLRNLSYNHIFIHKPDIIHINILETDNTLRTIFCYKGHKITSNKMHLINIETQYDPEFDNM